MLDGEDGYGRVIEMWIDHDEDIYEEVYEYLIDRPDEDGKLKDNNEWITFLEGQDIHRYTISYGDVITDLTWGHCYEVQWEGELKKIKVPR